MPQQTLTVRHLDPAEDQLPPYSQRMDVVAAAHSHRHSLSSMFPNQRGGRGLLVTLFSRVSPVPRFFIRDARIASPITMSSGLVTLIFSPLPSITVTGCPSHSTRNASSVALTPSPCAFL